MVQREGSGAPARAGFGAVAEIPAQTAKVRDREGAIASTRGACAPQIVDVRGCLTYNSSGLSARFRNEAARDVVSEGRFDRCLEIPKRKLKRTFHRRVALRLPGSDVLRENARRMIHLAPAHQCTSAQRTRESRPRARRVRALD